MRLSSSAPATIRKGKQPLMPETVHGNSDSTHRTPSKILRIAALDFALAPPQVIEQELKLSRHELYRYRNTDLYRQTMQELQQAFKEQMLRSPGTSELRHQISYGLGIAVKKLLAILSLKKTPNRDLIAAARLMAQLDGRFLGHDAEEARAQGGADTESVATELIQMIQRVRSAEPPNPEKVQ